MWTDPSERPEWWPKELPDIYITDSPEIISEKIGSIPVPKEDGVSDTPEKHADEKSEQAPGWHSPELSD